MGQGLAGPGPDQFTPEEVEGWPEFREALVKPLVFSPARPIQPFQAPVPVRLSDAEKRELTKALESIAGRFGMVLSEPLEFGRDRELLSVSHKLGTGEQLQIGMADGKLRRVIIGAKNVPGTGAPEIARDRFPAYAAEVYGKAFGTEPHGEPLATADWELTWVPRLPGVVLEDSAQVRLRFDHGAGLVNVYLMMGPDPAALAAHLKKLPTLVTAEQAMAIAWKTMKSLMTAEDRLDAESTRIFYVLRNGTASARTAELDLMMFQFGKLANDPRPPAFDPLFYQIEVRDGLFHAKVDVDRRTGTVIHLRYGKMSW